MSFQEPEEDEDYQPKLFGTSDEPMEELIPMAKAKIPAAKPQVPLSHPIDKPSKVSI